MKINKILIDSAQNKTFNSITSSRKTPINFQYYQKFTIFSADPINQKINHSIANYVAIKIVS
jgi:hypothetical protein